MTRALNLTMPLKQDENTTGIVHLLLNGGFNVPASQLQAVLKLPHSPLINRDGQVSDPSIQDRIEFEVKNSRRIHFLRVLIIPESLSTGKTHDENAELVYKSPEPPYKFIQVLTEYEGTRPDYTDFFRKQLADVFALVFGLVEGVDEFIQGGAAELVKDQPGIPAENTHFWKFSRQFNIHSLGRGESHSADGDDNSSEGYLFSAYAYDESDPNRGRIPERSVVEVLKSIKISSKVTDELIPQILEIQNGG